MAAFRELVCAHFAVAMTATKEGFYYFFATTKHSADG